MNHTIRLTAMAILSIVLAACNSEDNSQSKSLGQSQTDQSVAERKWAKAQFKVADVQHEFDRVTCIEGSPISTFMSAGDPDTPAVTLKVYVADPAVYKEKAPSRNGLHINEVPSGDISTFWQSKGDSIATETATGVTMNGDAQQFKSKQSTAGIYVQIPGQKPAKVAYTLEISGCR